MLSAKRVERTNAYQASKDPEFIGRVTIAVIGAAIDIINEDPGTKNHDVRAKLANTVLASPEGWGARFALLVMSNAAIAAVGTEATENDIDYVIATIWDAVAGAVS